MYAMNTFGFFIFCAASLVLCRALEAPDNVRLERNKALLRWSSNSLNATYTAQYQTGDGEWRDLPGCVNTLEKQCEFSAMATQLYGATLRVQAQRHNVSSPWQQSQQRVACVHTRSCSPEVVAVASPGYLSIQMDRERRDQSLQDEYGAHLSYRVLHSREGENMQVFCKGCVSAVRVEPLPVGERWCVQVGYLLYSQPHGSLSNPECLLIPQSEWEWELSVVGALVAVFLTLVALGIIFYCLIRHYYTDIKDYMRPWRIPDHFIEVFHQPVHQPLFNPSAEPQSHDLISSVEEVEFKEEEEVGTTTLSQSDGPTPVDDRDHQEEEERGEEGGVAYRDYEGSGFNSNSSV